MIGILFGYGNGSFETPTNISVDEDSFPFDLVPRDLNNDQRMDIIFSDNSNRMIRVLLGNGDGTFRVLPPITSPGIILIGRILVEDITGDGRFDLVVLDGLDNTLIIFHGYGNGSFQERQTLITNNFGFLSSATIGDFNNDRQQDIIASDSSAKTLYVFFGVGNGSFAAPILQSISQEPTWLDYHDFNDDGILELLVVSRYNASLQILSGFGNGSFKLASELRLNSRSSPEHFFVADLDNNQSKDIVIVNFGTNSITLVLFDKNVTIIAQRTYSTGSNSLPTNSIAVDLDNDNDLDIVVPNRNSNTLRLFINTC